MDKILQFTNRHTLLVLALTVSFFVVVFSELRRKAGGLTNIESTDAVKLINNDALVIDIRNVDAYAKGHIAGARNIPSDELDARVNTLEAMKTKPIIAVCNSGVTSNTAVKLLGAAGFESVYGLKGGMAAWSQAGLPVVTGKKTRARKSKKK